jgi:hypothetical protein
MTMQNCPALTAVVVQQRHQDLRHEVQREHAARIAAAANNESQGWPWTPLKAVAASLHAGSAHRLSGVARRVELRLSAWRATPSGA